MQAFAPERCDVKSTARIEIPDWFDDELHGDLISKIHRKRGCLSFFDSLALPLLALFHRRSSAWRYTQPYSWKELEDIIEADCLAIRDSDFAPDVVLGVKSGGAFIAKYVAQCLAVNRIEYVSVDRYSPVFGSAVLAVVFKYFRQAKLLASPPVDLCNQRVLLVDDQIRSGKSLAVARGWVERQGAAEVRSYCLFTQGAKADFGNRVGIMMNSPWGDDP